MKKIHSVLFLKISIVWLCALLPGRVAAGDTAGEAAEIRRVVLEGMALELQPLRGPGVGEVLRTSVWEMEVTVLPDEDQGGRARGNQKDRVFLADGAVRRIVTPTTNMDLPYFQDLIDPAFALTAESAPLFHQMLQTLMPRRFFDEIEPDVVQVDDETWHFYTGTFFDNLKAFVVSVDETGRVVSVRYHLRLPDNR